MVIFKIVGDLNLRTHNSLNLFSNISPILKEKDIHVDNLETVLSDESIIVTKYFIDFFISINLI